MKTMLTAATIVALAAVFPTEAAEPIAGKWRTANGETAGIAPCYGDYCITVETGEYAGRRIGRLAGAGDAYNGEITDPSNDRTYAGSARIEGASLKLTGCALKIFCRSQTWTRR